MFFWIWKTTWSVDIFSVMIKSNWSTSKYSSWRSKPNDGPNLNKVLVSRMLKSSSQERPNQCNMLKISSETHISIIGRYTETKKWDSRQSISRCGIGLRWAFHDERSSTRRLTIGLFCCVRVLRKQFSAPENCFWHDNCCLLCRCSQILCPKGLPSTLLQQKKDQISPDLKQN